MPAKDQEPFDVREFLDLRPLWAPPTAEQKKGWGEKFSKLIQLDITKRPQLITLRGIAEEGGEVAVATARKQLEGLTKEELSQIAELLEAPPPEAGAGKDEMVEKILPLVFLPVSIGEVWLKVPGSTEGDNFYNTSADSGRVTATKSLILNCLLHPDATTFLKQMNVEGYYSKLLGVANPLLAYLGLGETDIGVQVKNG